MAKIQEVYINARKHLQLSQRKAAELAGLTNGAIRGIESGKVNNPNWIYTKFLIEQGINPFYLIGVSDQIEGQMVDCVHREKYEKLLLEHEGLREAHEKLQLQVDSMISRTEFDELRNKYEALESLLQKSLTGQINKEDVGKKNKRVRFNSPCVFPNDTRTTHGTLQIL